MLLCSLALLVLRVSSTLASSRWLPGGRVEQSSVPVPAPASSRRRWDVASFAGCRFMQVAFTCVTRCHITGSLVTVTLPRWMHVASKTISTPLTMPTSILKLKRCSLSEKQNIVCIMPETTSTCRVYTTRPRVKCLLLHVTLHVSSTASSSVDNNTNINFPFDVDCQAPSRQTVLINSPSCLRSPIRISTKSAHIEKLELSTAKQI